MNIFDLAPKDSVQEQVRFTERTLAGEDLGFVEATRVIKGGQQVKVQLTASRLRGDQGETDTVATTERLIQSRT